MRATTSEPQPPPVPASTPLPYDQRSDGQATSVGHWWIWLIVFCVLGVAGYFLVPRIIQRLTGGPPPKQRGPGIIPVVVATARVSNMNLYLNGLGTVTAFNTVTIRSRVDGQIVAVNYTEGQFVKEGDLLIRIDPRPFQVQLTQAQGQLARDQSLVENAQRDLQRFQSISTSIPQQQIDTQKALVNQYLGAVKTDEGQVKSAQLNLTYSDITAPISGRIGLRIVDIGNIIHANDPTGLAVITQLQPISVIFPIPQEQISEVFQRPDRGDGLPVDVLSQDLQSQIATGQLLTIDNQVDPTTGTVKLKGVYPNTDNALFPNEFVNARLLVKTLENVVIVPSAAIQRGPDNGTFVYVVKSDKTVELRKMTAGPTEGENTMIQSGIAAGDVVVIDGVDKLEPGVKVAPRAVTRSGAATRPGRPAPASTQAAPPHRSQTQPTTRAATGSPQGRRPHGGPAR